MTDYPMTENEFNKRVCELFMGEFKQIPDKDKIDYLNSKDTQNFIKELYQGTCNHYDIRGWKDAFTDEYLMNYAVNNLSLYF